MDIEQKTQKQIKRVLTSRGPIPYEQINQKTLIISNQYINPSISKQKSIPLTLQSLSFHRKNPYTLQNASITGTLFQHQLNQLNLPSPSEIYIIDVSKWMHNQVIPENLRKYNIIKGFTHDMPTSIIPSKQEGNKLFLSKQAQASTSIEYISKQIEFQFNPSSSIQNSGYIGMINLQQEMSQIELEKKINSQLYRNAFQRACKCYNDYSLKYHCPIFINLNKTNVSSYFHIFQQEESEQKKLECIKFQQSINYLKHIVPNRQIYNRIVLCNPQFLFDLKCSQQPFTISIIPVNIDKIKQMYKQGFYIFFELARYQNREALLVIGHLLKQFPDQTLIGCGMKYKTDMTAFGGQGLKMQNSIKIILSICKKIELISESRRKMIELLIWNIKREQIKQIRMWKCVKCQKQSPQTQEAFRKFGKDFCSIGCLKSYKF